VSATQVIELMLRKLRFHPQVQFIHQRRAVLLMKQ
jgi:hypothetical protein